MDDLSSMINNVLNDPEAMEKISSIAQSLNLGSTGEDGKKEDKKEGINIDAKSLLGLQKAIGALGQDNENIALLRALKPFLSEKRSKKVDDAIKIMGLLKLLPLLKEGGLDILGGGR